MNDLERFHCCMDYGAVDHHPFWGWGAWPETLEKWREQGYEADGEATAEEKQAFDRWGTMSIRPRGDRRQVFDNWFYPCPQFAHEVLEEDDHTVVYVNIEGIVMRELKVNPMSSMPEFVRFPVETREDFRRFRRERMRDDLCERIGPDWKDQLRGFRREECPFIVWADRWGGFFGPLRNLVGLERLCTLFYDDPAFVEEMMDADADFLIAMMSQILDVVEVDAFLFWEDMAYKTAPLISPELARRYMLPRYKRVVDMVRSRGVRLVGLDSDGCMESLIPVWLDAGINVLFPFEMQAGMDVLEVRKKYGKDLRLWGGVDKRALSRGPADIDSELRRIRPLIEEGGYIPHLDHFVPPDVSLANYRYYMARLSDLCHGRWGT